MNVRMVFGTFAILLSMIQLDGFPTSKGQPTGQTRTLAQTYGPKSVMNQILGATVEIEMTYQAPVKKSGENKLMGRGLGSLVWSAGEVLLVTHNHWGEVLRDQTVIVFYNNDRRVLKIMLGKEFQHLAIYRDAGTLLLRAPDELAQLIEPLSSRLAIGKNKPVKVGDTVLLVYHQTENEAKVGLLEAKVVGVDEYKALPVFVLHSLDGTTVMQGDSGGGIWHEGKLVGNLWATIIRDMGNKTLTSTSNSMPVQQRTDKSFGAIFPSKVLESK